jgi:hypothetical protein
MYSETKPIKGFPDYEQVSVAADGRCMYRAIALFEYNTEDRHDTVRNDMLMMLNLKMMQQIDQEVKKNL